MLTAMNLACVPLTADRFDDLARLFGSDRETANCWCMYWRVTPAAWRAGSAAGRREAFRARVEAGPPPGVVACRDGMPVGWSARPNPRDADLDRTWIISCFFLRREVRGEGLMTTLAEAACRHAAEHGAVAVEAAPVAPRRPLVWGEGFVGIASALERAGFAIVERRTELRSLMRWTP